MHISVAIIRPSQGIRNYYGVLGVRLKRIWFRWNSCGEQCEGNDGYGFATAGAQQRFARARRSVAMRWNGKAWLRLAKAKA